MYVSMFIHIYIYIFMHIHVHTRANWAGVQFFLAAYSKNFDWTFLAKFSKNNNENAQFNSKMYLYKYLFIVEYVSAISDQDY